MTKGALRGAIEAMRKGVAEIAASEGWDGPSRQLVEEMRRIWERDLQAQEHEQRRDEVAQRLGLMAIDPREEVMKRIANLMGQVDELRRRNAELEEELARERLDQALKMAGMVDAVMQRAKDEIASPAEERERKALRNLALLAKEAQRVVDAAEGCEVDIYLRRRIRDLDLLLDAVASDEDL